MVTFFYAIFKTIRIFFISIMGGATRVCRQAVTSHAHTGAWGTTISIFDFQQDWQSKYYDYQDNLYLLCLYLPDESLRSGLSTTRTDAGMKDGGTQSTLLRGFTIIEKIVASDRPLSSAYLAEELDLPKPTVHRICQQLEEEGLLQREPGGKRFTGGKRLRKIAMATLSNSVLSAHRSAILQDLSQEVGETCNLTVLDGHEIVYLDRIETNWPYRIHLPVGSHLPLHCTATGKLFLANMKPAARRRMIHSLSLNRHTELTITDPELLEEQLQKIADEGVGYDAGEYLEGMVAIAVPVIGENNQMCFALAIHAPSVRKTLDELRQYLPTLRHAAARMAASDCGADEGEDAA
jgi:DNA-binding IclR family transcriptional regulator